MIVIAGLWLAVIGYGVAYAGAINLGGGKCSLGQSFQGKCTPASQGGAGGAAPAGLTRKAQRLAAVSMRESMIGSTPL